MEKKSRLRKFLTKVGSVRLSQIWDKLRKPFNFCWKTGLAIFAIVFVVQLGEDLVRSCKYRLGLTYYSWRDESLGEKTEIRYFSNNQCAVYNKITDKRVSPKVRWISSVPERDSLTVFCDKEGRRGYLNVNTGEIVIDGQYKHAWHFSEGLGAVVADNGKVGFVNYDNEFVIPAEYDYVADYDYIFIDGVCILPDDSTGRYGVIDTLGNIRLPMEYSGIYKSYDDDTWYLHKDGKCGLADAGMNIIFEPVYDNISVRSAERDAYLTRDGIKQLISFEGEVILPFVIDEAWPLEYRVASDDDEGNSYVMHPYLVEVMVDYNCRGVMDSRTGKMLIPAVYTEIDLIAKDLIMAEVDGNEENNVIFDTSGRMVRQ